VIVNTPPQRIHGREGCDVQEDRKRRKKEETQKGRDREMRAPPEVDVGRERATMQNSSWSGYGKGRERAMRHNEENICR